MPRGDFGGKGPSKTIWTPLPSMEEYLAHLRETRSEAHAARVSRALSLFARYAETEDIQSPEEIERKHLYRFDNWLRSQVTWHGKIIADSTRSNTLTMVRAWVIWAFQHGYVAQNPWAMIKIANPRRKKPRPFQEEELIRVFESHKRAAFSTTPFNYHRRDVILALLYGWGLRPSEITSLTVTAMDVRLDQVTIKKANGDVKKMPYGHEMKTIILRWLRVRGAKAKRGEDALLINQEGVPIGEIMIGKILKDLGSNAGIDLSATRFRENFQMTLMEQGIEIKQVAEMLGLDKTRPRRISLEEADEGLKETYDFIIDPLMRKHFGGM